MKDRYPKAYEERPYLEIPPPPPPKKENKPRERKRVIIIDL